MGNPEVESLKTAFSLANSWNEWSTILVVIGVIIEFAALLFFSKHMSRGEKTTLFIGSVFVILGVWGEDVYGSRASSAAAQLQQLSDQKVAALQKDQEADHKIAAQATKDAANLGLKLKDLNQFVEGKATEIDLAKNELKKDTAALDKARDESVSASKKAKKYLEDASILLYEEKAMQEKLNKQLSDTKQNIEELQKAIDPRRLTDAQKSTLAVFLRDKPKGKLIIFAFNGAFDSKFYTDEIAETLKSSGWDVAVEIGGGPFWDNAGSGNHIHYGNVVSHDAAKILYSALKASNISIDDDLNPEPVYKVMPDKVVLFIGTKY